MTRKGLVRGLLAGGGLLLVAALILGVSLLMGAGVDPLWRDHLSPFWAGEPAGLTPPASLADAVEAYPELTAILSDPALEGVYKEFLLAYQDGGAEAAMVLAGERGLLTPDGENLRVTLILDTEDSAPLTAQLEAVGVEVVSVFRDRVNVSVPVGLIGSALETRDTESIFRYLTELDHVIAVRLPDLRSAERRGLAGEGVGVVGAEAWHRVGFSGEGVRIGVLDLGFSGYEALLGEELPEGVTVKKFGWYDEQEVHGVACAEIVHALAPDATLFFAWYDGSDAALGEAVAWLTAQKVDIITHSAGGVLGPRDGTGWDARLVEETVAQEVLWVNSAGNEAEVHYRGVFTDQDGDGYHEFRPGVSVVPIHNLGYIRVYLTWEDDWHRPTQDLELVIFDGGGDVIAASEDPQDGSVGQMPAEWIVLHPDDDIIYAAVYAYAIDRPVTFDIFAIGPGARVIGAVAAYSINSPGDAVGALTVGAVEWDSDRLAPYSSQGPTPDGRLKPDISAPTDVSGRTYGQRGFDGTSAAAPHVAGAAALVWQAYPTFSREQVIGLLLDSARDLGPAGPDTGYGFGRLALPAPPVPHAEQPQSTVEVAAGAPSSLLTATPLTYVTPASGQAGGGGRSFLIAGLLVGGLSLGGSGLLLAGGVLLLIEARGRRAQQLVERAAGPQPTGVHAEWPQNGQAMPPGYVSPKQQLAPPDLPTTQRRTAAAKSAAGACPVCLAAIRPGARFCADCGTKLVETAGLATCRHCGARLREHSRFCPACGKPA